jgi:hypothetical protein
MSGRTIIIYPAPDGKTCIQLRAQDGSVWLTQMEIAELFQTTKQNVGQHIKKILGDSELPRNSVVKESFTTAADGKKYLTLLYNLEMILAVGYRVKSPRGTQFRQWATTNLREYLKTEEVEELNRIVVMFLDYAEDQGEQAAATNASRLEGERGPVFGVQRTQGAEDCRRGEPCGNEGGRRTALRNI